MNTAIAAVPAGALVKGVNAVVDALPENESAINGTDVGEFPMYDICLFSSFYYLLLAKTLTKKVPFSFSSIQNSDE
jgi:hypothetical protein